MVLGGVATGSMNAQEAPMVTGKSTKAAGKSNLLNMAVSTGKTRMVEAVLELISVKKVMNSTSNIMRPNNGKLESI